MKQKRNNREMQVQRAVVDYLRVRYPNVIFGVNPQAGMKLTVIQAVNAKRMGYRRGWPDLFIAEPHGGKHGLFLELKSETAVVGSMEQIQLLDDLRDRGYTAYFAFGTEEAIEVIDQYMKGGCDE